MAIQELDKEEINIASGGFFGVAQLIRQAISAAYPGPFGAATVAGTSFFHWGSVYRPGIFSAAIVPAVAVAVRGF